MSSEGAAGIDLRREDERAFTALTVGPHGRTSTTFGLYIFPSDDPGAELGRMVERSVFAESFGDSEHLLTTEYSPYEATSVFICVIDHRRMLPVGTVRLILPGPAGLKSLQDIPRDWGVPVHTALDSADIRPEPGTTWDIATLAVAAGYRNGTLSTALFQGIGTLSALSGCEWYVSILDIAALRLVQLRTGRTFSRFPCLSPKRYLGSLASLPVWSDFTAHMAKVRERDLFLYETLFQARHLEPILSLPRWEEAVQDVERLTARRTAA